jgi:hypothetical protein
MTHSIEIYCDDLRHARGKVAKIATLTVHADGAWSAERPQGARMARAGRKTDAGQVRNRDALARSVFGSDAIRCKLCGRHLPRHCGERLGQAARQLAYDGVPSISLTKLVAMIARQEGR